MAIDWTLLLPAVLTIGAWTIVFGDNYLYKLCEYTSIGLGPAYVFVSTVKSVQDKALTPVLTSMDIGAIIGIALGILVMFRLAKGFAWLSRPSMAIIVGTALGINMRGFLQSQLVAQMLAAVKSLGSVSSPWLMFNNILILAMTVGSTAYFVFTRQHSGSCGYLTKFGRYSLMLAWGAMYATTTTGRINYLIGRLQFIYYNFLGIVPA